MTNENEKKAPVRSAAETFRTEAEAEARQRALVAEARLQQSDRCPECGSLGSLEVVDGVVKCLDCDADLMAQARLGGLGKK